MKRAIFRGTITAGAVAAYLMYRRGEPVGSVARKAILHPVGSLVSEVRAVRFDTREAMAEVDLRLRALSSYRRASV